MFHFDFTKIAIEPWYETQVSLAVKAPMGTHRYTYIIKLVLHLTQKGCQSDSSIVFGDVGGSLDSCQLNVSIG